MTTHLESPTQLNSPTQLGASATSLPTPDLSMTPNVPRDMLALANALDSVTVPVFPDTATRDAARTAGAQFNICMIAGVPWMIKSGAWVTVGAAGAQLITSVFPTSTTLPAGGGTLGLIPTPTPVGPAPYDRLVRAFIDVTISSAPTSTYLGVGIVQNGGGFITSVRGYTAQTSLHCEWVGKILANAAQITLQPQLNSGGACSTYGAPLGLWSVYTFPA